MSVGEAHSALFDDYLFRFARVASFYPAGAPFDFDRLAARARELDYPAPRRAAMAAELLRQNPGQSAAVAEFAEPGTVAVVTGQQVGLFGGPLLGLHKAMTAVRIAERLRAQGTRAVAVFWTATQDHDLAEVNQAWVPDEEGALHRLQAEFPAAAANHPVGSLALDDSILTLEQEAARLSPGDWQAVARAYRPGATLGEAFATLLGAWFASWGLLLFDPRQAAAAHALWQPYYLAAFDRQPELAAQLAQRAEALLDAGGHVQVEQTQAASMLFLEDASGRLGLRRRTLGQAGPPPEPGRASSGSRGTAARGPVPVNDSAWLLGEREVPAAVLRQRIADAPALVSPAALLRPVLQDVAFPTVAHVVGPSETAYLAQSSVLYEAFGVRQPVAWPRARITFVDAKSQRLLQKYSLSLDDLRAAPAEDLLARRALPEGIEQRVATLRSTLAGGLEELRRDLQQLDPTLLDAANGAAQKIEHQLAQLEARVARSLARRSGELESQARHLDTTLFPRRQPQERVLTAAAYLARHPAMLETLHTALDPGQPAHQLIPLLP
ncbi:MAG: bacillithiol biosynthesis protein BshC [Terriglobales bacterium]